MLRGFPTVSYFDSNSPEYYNGVACCRLHVEKAARLYASLYLLISVSGDLVFGQYLSLSLSILLIPPLLLGVFKRARTFLLVSIGVVGIGLAWYIFCLGWNAWLIIRIIKVAPSQVKEQDEEDLPKTVFEIVRLLINITLGIYILHLLHCFWKYLTKAEALQQPFRIDEARLAEMAQRMREIEQNPRGRKQSTKLSSRA